MWRTGLITLVGALSLVALALLGGARACAADQAEPLDRVALLIGEWRIEAQWAGGEALKGRQTYEWGLNKKFVVARTYVTKNDGSGEYQRYESVFAVKDGKLVSYNFAFDGTSSVSEGLLDGDTLRVKREVEGPNGAMVIKQELELTSGAQSRWRVWVERDGKQEQVMDGTWVRAAKQEKAK